MAELKFWRCGCMVYIDPVWYSLTQAYSIFRVSDWSLTMKMVTMFSSSETETVVRSSWNVLLVNKTKMYYFWYFSAVYVCGHVQVIYTPALYFNAGALERGKAKTPRTAVLVNKKDPQTLSHIRFVISFMKLLGLCMLIALRDWVARLLLNEVEQHHSLL